MIDQEEEEAKKKYSLRWLFQGFHLFNNNTQSTVTVDMKSDLQRFQVTKDVYKVISEWK